jgi:exo-beta-1,3-glucanase (GH17 family)
MIIQNVDLEKNAIRLSDGHRYLFSQEHREIVSKWSPGAALWISEVGYPPNGRELRAVDAMSEFIVAIWVGL